MKNKLITLLKAIGIMVAFLLLALVMGMISDWSYILHLSILAIAFVAGIYYWYRHFRPKKRYYFVSYAHAKGFGATSMCSNGMFVRKDTEKFIDDKYFNSTKNIVVLYYKEISEEEFKGNKPCEK